MAALNCTVGLKLFVVSGLTLMYYFCLKLSVKCTKELIASSSSDSTVRIWRVDSGNINAKVVYPCNMVQYSIGICLHVLRGHIGVVRCLSFKGNNILISGGDRKRIIAWNTEVGKMNKQILA